ncbi:MAG: methionine gamma-lyase family protein [Candidatus Sericytochromatia bacterium]|nr:methionine gamma-lyase family protein [Candidatus Tanganyikabacteria bacterium]
MPPVAAHSAAALSAAEAVVRPIWERLGHVELHNTRKVLAAFREQRVGEEHFAGTTGYGHDDLGRECLERVVARVMGAEAALVRGSFASGTHAIAVALFGALSPGAELLSITGHPYDTLEEVIGLRGRGQGSLADWGVTYREIDLAQGGAIDLDRVVGALRPETRVVAIQRSRGYAWRPSVRIADIGRAAAAMHAVRPDVVVFVDNCYGEFVEEREPCDVGADLVASSLIKNPGGGIAPAGGYVAGRADLVHRAACRLTAPGIGAAGGATLDSLRLLFQGLFSAPHVVSEALRGAICAAQVFSALGYNVDPLPDAPRTDIIQAIRLDDPDLLATVCRTVQECSPVGSYVRPIPAVVPGYGDRVLMAAGTFIEGSTIELSCDGPLRPPFVAYLQGGLSYAHCRLALEACVAALS